MRIAWMIEGLLERVSFVAAGYAAYAALILLLVSLASNVPWKRRDGFREATRTAGVIVAGSGLLLLGTYVLRYVTFILSGDQFGKWLFVSRAVGPSLWIGYTVIFSKILAPQLLWLRSIRQRTFVTALIAAFALAGHSVTYVMFRISTAPRDKLPTSWGDLFWLLF